MMGANQRMILCKDRVVREQMMPNRQSTRMARRTVWRGELFAGVSKASRWGDYSLRGWRIRLERVRALGKVGVHDYSCKDHLRNGISETGHAGGLTKEITPPNDPRPDGDVLLGNDMLGYEIHAASRWIGRHQFRDCQASVGGMFCIGGTRFKTRICRSVPELAMHIAMTEPMNHAQTAVAGPPEASGEPMVAGTEPRTPRIEIAYDTVDHLLNSRRNSCL